MTFNKYILCIFKCTNYQMELQMQDEQKFIYNMQYANRCWGITFMVLYTAKLIQNLTISVSLRSQRNPRNIDLCRLSVNTNIFRNKLNYLHDIGDILVLLKVYKTRSHSPLSETGNSNITFLRQHNNHYIQFIIFTNLTHFTTVCQL